MSHRDIRSKVWVWGLLFVVLFGVTWCSSRISTQEISFDGYTMTIDERYTPVPNSLIENKQIINKVVKSYKINWDENFDENLIITSSSLAPELDYEQFWTVNTSKLKDQLAWYTPGAKKIFSFDCRGDSVEWILVSFSVKDTFVSWIDTYYIHQYQFVHNQVWYIISAATIEPKQEKAFEKRINSLSCIE